jgi:hypothetical protein
MKTVNDNLMPSKYFTVGQDDGYVYLYDKSNTVDPDTGKYRKFEGGGSGGASSMSDLDDVLLSTLEDGQTLIWDDTEEKWVNGTITVETDLASLTDVNLTSPTDGQMLKYDATSGKWINGSGGSVSVASLGDIEDVNLSNIADGQIIKWDATTAKWVNANAPKERELTQAEYNALSQQEKMNGTTYYITDGEGGGSSSVQKATLGAGATTVSFNYPTTGDYVADVYVSDGRCYTSVDTSVSGTVTFTFTSSETSATVFMELKEV